MTTPDRGPVFPTREPVDFVVVGSGAAGGVLAKELSTKGYDVVLLEQGPFRESAAFTHDELSVIFQNELVGGMGPEHQQTYRVTDADEAQVQNMPPPAFYARTVGGSSVHFTGNYWRFRPVDFNEHSLLGSVPGANLADWPLGYDELEPYYTRVDWEVGVSGAQGPSDPPRSKPFPVPPLPNKSAGVLLERGAKALGLHAQPAPMAILSRPHNGRSPCVHCGFCLGFGCEVGAKSSTLVSMIPAALASGRCELRTECTAFRLVTDDAGRISEVLYFDADGKEQGQRAKAVILAANGAETPRLLFLSETDKHPEGLANSSGLVGRNLMFNTHSVTHGLFDEPLNEYKSVQVTRILMDFYDSDEKRGFYGGCGLDARPFLSAYPVLFSMMGLPPDAPQWGAGYKRMLSEYYTRSMVILGNGTSLPIDANNITLDPNLKDKWGLPVIRVTYKDHDDDMALTRWMRDRSLELMDAAGSRKSWADPVVPQNVGAHLLGTCRMGDDPESSVVDRYHRSHDISNLFMCDGSSFVTAGRGQPTMTIQALAFRAAEHIMGFAKRGEI